jgi:hypothetical protein
LRRHVEDRVASALPGEANNHLSGLYDLARFCAHSRHRSRGIGIQRGPADAVPRNRQLRLRVFDLGLRILQRLVSLIEPCTRRMAVGQQLPLPFEVAACVIQLALGGGEGRFGRTEHAKLVLWIEFGQCLSRFDPGAGIDRSLDYPPAETKSK